VAGRIDAAVAPRARTAFQADALFGLVVGSILMANPLLGPRIGVNGFLVAFGGILLLVAAIVLGGAGLGKGPLHGRLGLLAAVNAVGAVAVAAWAALVSMPVPGRVFLGALAVGLTGLAVFQWSAVRDPVGSRPVRRPPTAAELRAALRGESPRSDD
jgi:hypothetical protein